VPVAPTVVSASSLIFELIVNPPAPFILIVGATAPGPVWKLSVPPWIKLPLTVLVRFKVVSTNGWVAKLLVAVNAAVPLKFRT